MLLFLLLDSHSGHCSLRLFASQINTTGLARRMSAQTGGNQYNRQLIRWSVDITEPHQKVSTATLSTRAITLIHL